MSSGAVWVVLQQREGKLHRMSWEALAAGQKLADLTGGNVEAVVLGRGVEGVAKETAGADLAGVRVLDGETLAAYTPGAYVAALAGALAGAAPAHVLFPHTYQSVEYVPRLAQAVGAALVPEVTAFRSGAAGVEWQRPVLGGKLQSRVRARPEGTVLVTVQSGAFPADEVRRGSAPVSVTAVEPLAAPADREILGVEEVAGEQVDLSAAQVVVAVGRGVGGADRMEAIQELARLLGAELGASRPVIDNGWLPRDRQIGSSGQTVSPRLYLALGISGAIQHLVGMRGAQTIVAVNKDPTAPIFSVSQYGIVGDLHEVVPALVEALREAKGA